MQQGMMTTRTENDGLKMGSSRMCFEVDPLGTIPLTPYI
jgi:hypothetical protein